MTGNNAKTKVKNSLPLLRDLYKKRISPMVAWAGITAYLAGTTVLGIVLYKKWFAGENKNGSDVV